MENYDKSPKQNQHEASEILKDLFNNGDNFKPAKQTTEVRQLFIGNLPFRARWQDMKDLFRKVGQVIRADVALNQDNRSKGHGTVLFATVEDAQKAIDAYNGYKWLGRVLEVRADRGFVDTVEEHTKDKQDFVPKDKEEQAEKEMDQFESPPSKTTKFPTKEVQVEDECKQVFVGNLPFHCHWQELKNLFKSEGRVIRADVVVNFEGRSRGFGTVLYASHEHAKKAIEKYNGFEFHDRTLRVHFDKFAANHQKLREYEADTYGQRKIHDPASIELLRQTYLPQQTVPVYKNLMAPYMLQTPPYFNSMATASTSTISTDSTLYNPNNYYNTTQAYNNDYNSQPSYYQNTTNSMGFGNNRAMYSAADDRTFHAMNNMAMNKNSQPWMQSQQSTSSPRHLMQYQYLRNEQDTLSDSLNRLHLPDTQ